MKKIVIASLSATLATSAFAVADFTSSTTAGATTSLTQTNCALLNSTDTVRVNLSINNIGSYDCNTTTGSIGVSVASPKGRNKVFSATSAGGGVSEATLSSVPTTSNTQSAATTASASS